MAAASGNTPLIGAGSGTSAANAGEARSSRHDVHGFLQAKRPQFQPFGVGQGQIAMVGVAPQAQPNQALLFSMQQQQHQLFPGGFGATITPQLNSPAGVGGAYWNAFSVIGSSRIEPFPERLHRLLREVEASGRTDVISWVHDGRGFEIHKSEKFFRDICSQYFKQSKLSSFKRQLGLYGFQLFTAKHTKGGSGAGGVGSYYAHKDFLRDMPDLCRRMRRTNQQGTVTFGKGKDKKVPPKKKKEQVV